MSSSRSSPYNGLGVMPAGAVFVSRPTSIFQPLVASHFWSGRRSCRARRAGGPSASLDRTSVRDRQAAWGSLPISPSR